MFKLTSRMLSNAMTLHGPTCSKSNDPALPSPRQMMTKSTRGITKTFNVGSLVTSMTFIKTGRSLRPIGRPGYPQISQRLGHLVHSPQVYTGPDVQGNVDPGSQNIVATRPFTITSNGTMVSLTFELLEALVSVDGRRGHTRFQLGQLPAGRGGKETVIRLRTDLPVTSPVGAPVPPADRTDTSHLHLPHLSAYFCMEFMLSVSPWHQSQPSSKR